VITPGNKPKTKLTSANTNKHTGNTPITPVLGDATKSDTTD